MKAARAIFLALAITLWALPSMAVWYGPPVPGGEQGDFAAGVAVTDINRKIRGGSIQNNDYSRETLFADYTLSEQSALRGEVSTVDLGEFRGTELAVGYWRSFGEPRKIADGDLLLRKGFFGSFRSANLSGGGRNANFFQVDLGGGVTFERNEEFSFYAGGVISLLDGTAGGQDFEGDSSVGIFGGLQFSMDKEFRLGAELHFLKESGFGIAARYLF